MKSGKLISLLLTVAVLAGCQKAETIPPLVTLKDLLPKQAQPKLPTMKIFLGTVRDNQFRPMATLDAELALTPIEQETGMMLRTNIQDTDSMLFVLPTTQRADFWMMNCPESISAAYISPDGVIQEIHHLEKNDTNGVLSATDNIRFVLETSDGWFARHNIGTGMIITTEKGTLPETFLKN